jgi:hypothetical protein
VSTTLTSARGAVIRRMAARYPPGC